MYMKVTYDCGGIMDVQLYYPGNYGAPGKPRCRKQKRTPEDIARQNHTNRVNKVRRIILTNFRKGDWHLTLNYRKNERPETIEQAKDNLRKFLDGMRKVYKKSGYTFKYIGVTEIGKRGQALHHHLIIEDIKEMGTVQLVKQLWTHGGTFWSAMYEEGDFRDLASYIVKKETKVGTWSTYTRSRGNLKEPKVDRQPMKRKTWPEHPWIKKGYIMIKDSLVDGINPVTEYPYRHYSMRRIQNVTGKEIQENARNHLHRDHPPRTG